MNPIILPPSMGKIGQTGFFSLGEATSLGEKKLNSNLLNSLKIDLVSYPAQAEGLVNIDNNPLQKNEQFYLTHRWNPNRYYHSESK